MSLNLSRGFVLAAVLGVLSPGTASYAQNANLNNLPANTVVGRLGSSVPGAAQAIPFTTLTAALVGLPNVVSGPVSTTVGDIVLWNSTVGTATKDSGVAMSGSGTIAMGSTNTLTLSGSMTLTGGGTTNVASGKTLTDTSAIGASVLLGATGGGFAAYGGATCATGALTALSAAGAGTCSGVKAATNSTKASAAASGSTSAFKMMGLAGTITPAVTGNVLITISGTMVDSGGNTGAGVGIQYQISYGTSTAPVNGAALTGTQVGTVQQFTSTATVTAADVNVPFSISVVVTGLTPGTPYWLDLAAENVSAASGYSFVNINTAANEI